MSVQAVDDLMANELASLDFMDKPALKAKYSKQFVKDWMKRPDQARAQLRQKYHAYMVACEDTPKNVRAVLDAQPPRIYHTPQKASAKNAQTSPKKNNSPKKEAKASSPKKTASPQKERKVNSPQKKNGSPMKVSKTARNA